MLRALPALHGKGGRATRRVGRWIAIGTLLAAVIGVGAVTAVAHSDAGSAKELRPRPAAPPTTTTAPPFTYVNGVIGTAEGHWAIGRADDVVVLGDWDCDGVGTPALLRPATGAIYAFNEWAPHERDVVAEMLGTLAGASELAADDVDGDGCDDVVAQTDEGEEMVFHPADRL